MILELIIRFFRKIATLPFFIFLSLMGVIGSAAYGLSVMIRGLGFGALFYLALMGVGMGWWLARTRLRSWLAGPLLLLLGFSVTYVWVGKLVLPVINLLRALLQTGLEYLRQDLVADLTALQLSYAEFSIATNTVWTDLMDWVRSLSTTTPSFHATSVFFVWGLAIWIIAAWAGWVQRRHHNAVIGIMPASLLLTTTMGYTYADTVALAPFFLSALLLIALTWLYTNESHWKTAGIDYPDDARFDTVFAFVVISIVLVAIAFFLPRISIRKVVEMVREWTNPQIEQAAPLIESFGVEPYRPSIGRFGSMLTAGLPRSHLLGSGPELSEQIVMSVQVVGGLPPGVEADDAVPLYWRGLTYDQYTGTGWDSSDVYLRHYRGDQQVGMFERPGYWIIEQEVRFTDESKLLFAAGDLISVDQAYRVAWRSEPWLSKIEQYPGDFFGATSDDLTYRAQSFVPVVNENRLRAAGYNYPDWIRENYILVPIETPQRVINLTRQLIAGIDNPYDRAHTLEQYLRQFEYTTDLPQPPADRDIVDYFLFDLQRGYCDYFATAMVVMARAADLPARLVVGYARGTYDSANDRYVVSEAEAHSWAEIYFEDIGWVPFEPTSGRKAIARSETPLQFPGDSFYVIEAESLMGGIKPLFGSWLLTFAIVALGLAWAWMVWITLDEWLLKRLSPAGMVTRLYERLYRHGRRLGAPARKEDTAYNFAAVIRRQLASVAGKSLGRKSMRQARQNITQLTDIYARAQFSPQTLPEEDKAATLAIWQQLRRQLAQARILYAFSRLRPKKMVNSDKEIQ